MRPPVEDLAFGFVLLSILYLDLSSSICFEKIEHFPNNLEYLSLSKNYEWDLDNIPNSLNTLIINSSFYYSVPNISNLETLIFNGIFTSTFRVR